MSITIEIPDLTAEECGDIAITAAEGGIGYWSVIQSYDWTRWADDDIVEPGHEVPSDFVFYTIEELDDEGVFDITPELINRGYEIWLQERKVILDDMGEVDAEIADVLVQYGCFGKVVYG